MIVGFLLAHALSAKEYVLRSPDERTSLVVNTNSSNINIEVSLDHNILFSLEDIGMSGDGEELGA